MSGAEVVNSLDLLNLERLYQVGAVTPTAVVNALGRRLDANSDPSVWIHRLTLPELLAQAKAVEQRRAHGESLPLYGVPFAVKDNIDVAGCPTTAACPSFRYGSERSAPVVARLLEAGALFVGKTNLDQFATGLAGDRSPYGACRNTFSPKYVSGGSSSGSAVAVAAGLVSFALGTDTAGSGRIPAGCNNLVGLKPTPGVLSTEGVVPACSSLDCVSVLALTVADAVRILAVARDGRSADLRLPALPGHSAEEAGPTFTFAVPRPEDLDFCGDDGQAYLFERAVAHLEKLGGRRLVIDLRPFLEVGNLLYDGPWIAERLAGLEDFLVKDPPDVYPVTRAILKRGAGYRGVDVFRALHRLQVLRAAALPTFDQADVLVVPTLPTIPTLVEVQADSAGWSRRLGRYTNFVNLLQLAALALPSGFTPRGLPGGITLIGPANSDSRLTELGLAWERLLHLPLGATGHMPAVSSARETTTPPRVADGHVRVAVAGAHLRGQPLHPELRRTGARLVRVCRTAPSYRFVALMDLNPPRPGLVREEDCAGAVEVEIYDVPYAGFGRLVASVAPPLAIGTIELADGEAVKGFLCESWAAARARDITEFGGWLAFRAHLAQAPADNEVSQSFPTRRPH